MKNFLQNLLIFFALCLCGLIAFQWVRETDLRRELQKLTNTVQDKTEAILNLQATVRQNNDEIKRLDGLRIQLTDIVKSNDVEIASLKKDLQKITIENDKNKRQMETYKEAFETEKAAVQQGNENIERLSADLKRIADDRNGIVKKLNKNVEHLNTLTEQLNTMTADFNKGATNMPAMLNDMKLLMAEWTKMQQDLAATNSPATNAPATNAPAANGPATNAPAGQ
jgi:chromosome segregation ATPase